MKKVYVVTQGEYSAYGIIAVFEDEGLANEFVANDGGDRVEPWELGVWRKEQGEYTFEFRVSDGTIVEESRTSSLEEPTEEVMTHTWNWGDNIRIIVRTGDRDRAIKIASERYIRIMAYMGEAKVLLTKASWYTPYPPGRAIYPQGVAVEIAEILAGFRKMPEGSSWSNEEGEHFGFSIHGEDIYRIMGIPLPTKP